MTIVKTVKGFLGRLMETKYRQVHAILETKYQFHNLATINWILVT